MGSQEQTMNVAEIPCKSYNEPLADCFDLTGSLQGKGHHTFKTKTKGRGGKTNAGSTAWLPFKLTCSCVWCLNGFRIDQFVEMLLCSFPRLHFQTRLNTRQSVCDTPQCTMTFAHLIWHSHNFYMRVSNHPVLQYFALPHSDSLQKQITVKDDH